MTGAAHAAPTDARTAWRTAWGAPARWAKRRWDAPITQCARLLPEACPRLTAALVVLILANAVIPAATIVATGLMIGSLSATVHAGLASPAGHRTLATLGAWAALMMLGEMEPRLLTAAAASAASRVESRVQERVIAALNRPWSIAHLESPRTADLLSQVSGLGVGAVGPGLAVSGLVTSRIPMILRSVVSGALLLAYSWPLALLLAAVQVFFVRQIRRGWVADAQNLLGKTDTVRRADYYRDLALGAGTAKEMRVLGLAGWLDARLRRKSMTGLMRQWKAHRRNALGGVVGATAAGLAGLVVYGLLARDAASGVITIGALVIYLRAAQAIGGWGPQQRRLPDRVRLRGAAGAARAGGDDRGQRRGRAEARWPPTRRRARSASTTSRSPTQTARRCCVISRSPFRPARRWRSSA